MHCAIKVVVLSSFVCAYAYGQAVPSATSGSAVLRYSLHYSETALLGGGASDQQIMSPSGSLSYFNGRRRHPFNLEYGGGYSWTHQKDANGTGFFERLMLSQGWLGRGWGLNVSNDLEYRHQAPISGFSGVPGTGEPIGSPSPGATPGESVFTVNTRVVNNSTQAQYHRTINHAMSASAAGSYSVLAYPDGNALDTRSTAVQGGGSYRIGGRSEATAGYVFDRYGYPAQDLTIHTNGLTFGYSRSWTRKLSSSTSGGSTWISRSYAPGSQGVPPVIIPSSTMFTMQADFGYVTRFADATVSYSRAATPGGGYLFGARMDQVAAALTKQLHQRLTVEAMGGYRRMTELGTPRKISGEFGSGQMTWRIGRYASAFGSYTAASQSSNTVVPSNVLSDFYQVISFGIGYSRRLNPAR